MTARFIEKPFTIWAPQAQALLDALGDIAYVAGGAARQMVMEQSAPPAWDIDLFLLNRDHVDECKRRLFALGYTQDAYTDHSAQFQPPVRRDNLDVQIIEFFQDEWSLTCGQPEEVLSHFSFTTEMFAVAIRDGKPMAIYGENSIADTLSRMLVVNNVTDPLVVSLRAVKYGYKGFGIAPWEMAKVFDAFRSRLRSEVAV